MWFIYTLWAIAVVGFIIGLLQLRNKIIKKKNIILPLLIIIIAVVIFFFAFGLHSMQIEDFAGE